MAIALLLSGVLAGLTAGSGDAAALPIPKLEPAITRAEVEAHVRWLASDELKGRVTGTPECERAAQYLAEVLRASGVEPAGDEGTFLQAVALERARLKRAPTLSCLGPGGQKQSLTFGTDFDLPWNAVAPDEMRLVVVKSAADLPKTADPKVALFVDGSSIDRRRWLAEAGLGAGEGFGAILAPGSKKPGRERGAQDLTGSVRRAGDKRGRNEGVVRVHGESAERFRKGDVRAIVLDVAAEVETVKSSNVLGRIPGRATQDAERRAIVISAHYDHIAGGHGPAKGTDTIYNGADDDASGVAIVLELAGALARGERAQQDVIVLLATGEEVGLLGTEHYLDHPVVPLERTSANLNFEMLGRPDAKVGGAGAMWLTGDEHTNLGEALREKGVRVAVDPRPDQHFFERSDNYAFVLRGVVGQTFSTYDMHTDYHNPSDEADKIDFAHLTACATTAEKVVRWVADGTIVPVWKAGKAPVRAR